MTQLEAINSPGSDTLHDTPLVRSLDAGGDIREHQRKSSAATLRRPRVNASRLEAGMTSERTEPDEHAPGDPVEMPQDHPDSIHLPVRAGSRDPEPHELQREGGDK